MSFNSRVDTNPDRIDRQRYRRITRFFGWAILHVIIQDLILGRISFFRQRVIQSRPERTRRIAHRFRLLAVEMGGVMIKLGQFLSTRIDVLPPSIIQELRGLQDEVPAVPFEGIARVLREELGETEPLFATFEAQPLAAASLGQTHRAVLRGEGESPDLPVVVKVQRPDIDRLVATDLAALRVVSRWIMRYRPISQRADLPALLEEFALTLHEELDYVAELRNARQFAAIFHDTPRIVTPRFHDPYCTGRVLVIENVEALKLDDVAAMHTAGIDTRQVADFLLESYYVQIFDASFFHADPHPGNIFVRPRPDLRPTADAPTPFDLIFIDFGMMGRIPAETRTLLQTVLVSVTLRDTRTYIDAIDRLGFLLPSADLDRIAEAHEQLLNQLQGRALLELTNPDPAEIRQIANRFKDVLFSFPFQIPQNFIYLGRAFGMLSGMSARLDPEINPWHYVELFGRRLVRNHQMRQVSVGALRDLLQLWSQFPARLRRIMDDLERGTLRLQTRPDQATRRQLDRIERRSRQLALQMPAAALLISGTLWQINGAIWPAAAAWSAAAALMIWSRLRS
jgi:predicted unusual protein kinase regulating ubiquinone biosynthesis (AarF/ABC1/UbiB family)